MILYNVTSSLEPTAADEWLDYMRSTHIPEVMETGFFIKSQLLRLLNEEEGGITYAAQYYCLSVEQLEEYQAICDPPCAPTWKSASPASTSRSAPCWK